MTTLYFVANSLNYLVAGTGNRSEIAVGYFTKHGDGGCDLLPLGNLLKTQVASLACELDIPPAILEIEDADAREIARGDPKLIGRIP